jgi:hypothetical protein
MQPNFLHADGPDDERKDGHNESNIRVPQFANELKNNDVQIRTKFLITKATKLSSF